MTRTQDIQKLEDLFQHVGQELAVTEWKTIPQSMIDLFAQATDDPDWMHVDVERAKNGPMGGTIAQGFLTLSLLIHFSHKAGYLPPDIAYAFNYGLDRVRWITPVPADARIRVRTELVSFEDKGDGRYLIKTRNTTEVDGEDKPAMIAEWLGLLQGGAETNAEENAWSRSGVEASDSAN